MRRASRYSVQMATSRSEHANTRFVHGWKSAQQQHTGRAVRATKCQSGKRAWYCTRKWETMQTSDCTHRKERAGSRAKREHAEQQHSPTPHLRSTRPVLMLSRRRSAWCRVRQHRCRDPAGRLIAIGRSSS